MYKTIFFIGIAFLLFNFTNFSFAQSSEKLVILNTQSGKMVIEFFPEDAPNHVENFLKLVESGFYDRTIFHRIIKDFMIQGGDPKTKPGAYTETSEWGTGNPGYTIDAEFNNIKHLRGIVSMARAADPNSAGSQFFIVHKDSNFLNQQYTVFGRLVTQESYDTLDKIASLKTAPNDIAFDWGKGEILKAEVVNRSEIPDLLNLGKPERTTEIIEVFDETYTNKKLGISFSTPAGWQIQQPRKTAENPGVPDIIALGPKISEMNPVISVSIMYTGGKSIDERLADRRDVLASASEEGSLKIISEEKTTVNGKDAYVLEALGFFERGNSTIDIKFREFLISTPEKFYTLTYTNEEKYFENHLESFEKAVNSFTILSEVKETSNEGISDEGGGCLIATATYGSELAPQVQQLRELRDNIVLDTQSGTAFMAGFNQLYYFFSPTIADWERENPAFKQVVKMVITPLLATLSILNYVDIDSEQEMLGYGIGIILLNIGIYFVAPLTAIYGLIRIHKT